MKAKKTVEVTVYTSFMFQGICGLCVPTDKATVPCTFAEAFGMLDPFQRNREEEVRHAA